MALNKVRVTSDGFTTDVEVDGHKVAVRALEVTHDAETRIPQVTIQLASELDIEVLGVAQILREPTVGEVMRVSAEWLEGLDPASVRAALESRSTTMRSDPVAAIIQALAAAAREVAD